MGMVNRKDLMTRVAGQKAQYDDEFIARAQIKAGRNIIVEWDNIHDCYIHAVQGYDDNETYLESLIGYLKIARKPTDQTEGGLYDVLYPEHTTMTVNYESKDIYNTAYQHGNPNVPDDMGYRYNEVFFVDIWHNWNLTNADDYLFEYQMKRSYTNGASESNNWGRGEVMLKNYPLNANAMRIYMQKPMGVHDHTAWKIGQNNMVIPGYQGKTALPTQVDIQVMFKLSRMQWPVHANQF